MELGDIGLGFVMLTIGLGSASLAALYWQVGGLTLLSFGLFAFLYGIQALLSSPSVAALVELPSAALLHVVSTAYYWLPVPGLIFLEQILGPGAWPLFRRLWQGWCVLALACIAHDLAVGPGASTFIYQNVFVVALVLVLLARFAWRGLPRTGGRRRAVSTAWAPPSAPRACRPRGGRSSAGGRPSSFRARTARRRTTSPARPRRSRCRPAPGTPSTFWACATGGPSRSRSG